MAEGKRDVEDVRFHIGKGMYKLDLVAREIAPHEVALLLQLAIALLSTRALGEFDVEGFVDKRGLWRFFTKVG